MRKEIISIGTEISTFEGKLVAKSYNGHIVYFYEYNYNPDSDSYEFYQERMLTLVEVAQEMKNLDGCNHKCVWE